MKVIRWCGNIILSKEQRCLKGIAYISAFLSIGSSLYDAKEQNLLVYKYLLVAERGETSLRRELTVLSEERCKRNLTITSLGSIFLLEEVCIFLFIDWKKDR